MTGALDANRAARDETGDARRIVMSRTISLGLGALAAAAGLVAWRAYPRELVARFCVGVIDAGLVVAAMAWRLSARPDLGEREHGRLPAGGIGIATTVTLFRGGLISLVAGFIFVPEPGGRLVWLPGGLYAVAVVCDRYDGVLARRLGQVTALGRWLDVEVDAFGLLIAPLVGVRWGRLPVWYLLLGAAYYLFAWGLWARRRLGLAVHAERLRPSRAARFFAGIQMTVTAVALFPVLPRWVTVGAATVAMLPTLGLFVRDWFIVIGRLPAIETPPQRW